MGGKGSGPTRRLTDDEKKGRGTYRNNQRAEALDEKRAAEVISGPWVVEIREPQAPMGEIGKKKYYELARALKEQGKLTLNTEMIATMAAVAFEMICECRSQGKQPTAHIMKEFNGALTKLRIAENGRTIDNPGQENKFAGHGWSHKKNSTFRLLGPSAASG